MANLFNKLIARFRSGGPMQMGLLAGPILILLVLSMMILPLPPFALDLFFTFNIALSIMVLLVSMFTRKPLEFAAFPAILLFATLLRLSLNVASTRTVLMHGHTGGDSAGKVIEAFGQFLVGGNFAVGLVVFLILIIINFMVITKGAGRIAEVGARFMLDAMPGKQMAIDADLNAGLIAEAEAKSRRQEVSQEADFYGSMDGASKFVRGDAVAGLIIMFVNIIGGLMIGMLQHDLSFAQASQSYILLTIGDGLVAQIPALVISTAAGVMVSRVDTDEDVGHQMIGQLFSNPSVLYLTAGVIGALGLVPGMPNFVFILFAVTFAAMGWMISRKNTKEAIRSLMQEQESVSSAPKAPEVSWEDVSLIDTLSLEVGHRLIPLVAKEDAELLSRIKGVRKKFAQDIGFLPPAVRIRDELDLGPNQYVITLKGARIGSGEVHPGKWLAINPGKVTGELDGIAGMDPAFGLPAVWIDSTNREHAQIYGYTVVDASTVVATHLNHLMQMHSSEMLGRHETQQLLEKMGEDYKSLVEEVIPGILSMTQLQRLLQRLLDEQVPIRDVRTILDTAAENAGQSIDVDTLLSQVRIALGRVITQQHFPIGEEIAVIGLDPSLEQILYQAITGGSALEPTLGQSMLDQAERAVVAQESEGRPAVMVVPHELRQQLSRFLRRNIRELSVMSQLEIPEDRLLRFTRLVGSGQG